MTIREEILKLCDGSVASWEVKIQLPVLLTKFAHSIAETVPDLTELDCDCHFCCEIREKTRKWKETYEHLHNA